MKTRRLAVSIGVLAALSGAARADTTLAGICPDGSYFIVQSRSAIPCANPHLADPSDLPPVRPYLLPKPYTWYVDQEARSANNPYNLLETARKIREARAAGAEPQGAASGSTASGAQAPRPAQGAGTGRPAPQTSELTRAPLVSLADDELRDLVRLIGLRQDAAPASFQIDDVHGAHSLQIQLAYSSAFEAYALATLGHDVHANRVIVWSAQAQRAGDFHPNFFVVQSGRTFRPDPQNPGELAFLLGAPGTLPAGEMAIGYLVMPASFDPTRELEVFWNDRSVATVLAPPSTASSH